MQKLMKPMLKREKSHKVLTYHHECTTYYIPGKRAGDCLACNDGCSYVECE